MRVLSAAAVVMLLGSMPAVAQDPPHHGNAQAGLRLALRDCSACHIVGARQERPLVENYGPSFYEIAKRPGISADALAESLSHPHPLGQMAFPQLTSEQTADVSAYILSLRRRR